MIIYALLPKSSCEALLLTTLLNRAARRCPLRGTQNPRRRGLSRRHLRLYGLMAAVVQQMDPMWLDAVIGRPSSCTASNVSKRASSSYTPYRMLVFIANFYIGYMVAIFTLPTFSLHFTTCEYGPGNASLSGLFKLAFLGALCLNVGLCAIPPTTHLTWQTRLHQPQLGKIQV